MGEAKRRKAGDPNFGTTRSRFSIQTSELTGNFLVIIDGVFCYDSASRESDAKKVIDDCVEYCKDHPLPEKNTATEPEYTRWTVESIGVVPIAESVAFRWDRQSGEINRRILDHSQAKKLSPDQVDQAVATMTDPALDELGNQFVDVLRH